MKPPIRYSGKWWMRSDYGRPLAIPTTVNGVWFLCVSLLAMTDWSIFTYLQSHYQFCYVKILKVTYCIFYVYPLYMKRCNIRYYFRVGFVNFSNIAKILFIFFQIYFMQRWKCWSLQSFWSNSLDSSLKLL